MFRVTVMIFRDIVESVTLLKDDAYNTAMKGKLEKTSRRIAVKKSTICLKASVLYPLKPWGALFSASAMALQQSRGSALFCGATESAHKHLHPHQIHTESVYSFLRHFLRQFTAVTQKFFHL